MLNQKPDDTTAVVDSTPEMVATVSPADLQAPVIDEAYQDLVEILKQGMQQQLPPTPDLYTSPDFNDFGDDFLTTSPDTDILNTPVINEDDIFTGMLDEDPSSGLLFPPIDYGSNLFVVPAPPIDKPRPQPSLPETPLYTLTPESPMLHDFSIDPSTIFSPPSARPLSAFPAPSQVSPAPAVSTPAPAPAPPAARTTRKASATGTRKGVTPQSLVPIDAPTQPRKYLTPSATSRKELPSAFAKKRGRSVAFGDDDEEDTIEPLGPNPTELELIEYKRRQNTVAARRSRKRKLEYQQHLEDRVRALEGECVRWKERVAICQELLRSHGVPPPVFVEEEGA